MPTNKKTPVKPIAAKKPQAKRSMTLTEDKRLFPLGQVLFTRNLLNRAAAARLAQIDILRTITTRHQCGDWGNVTKGDKRLNDRSVKGGRIQSQYEQNGITYWVVTEHDRSVTTALLPEDN